MKFAKELERDAVPAAWRSIPPRIKYLNYKAGKKHVKAVSKALVRTPRTFAPSHSTSWFLPATADRPLAEPYSTTIHARPWAEQAQRDKDAEFQRHDSSNSSAVDHESCGQDDEADDFELPAPAIQPTDTSEPSRPSPAVRSKPNRFAANQTYSGTTAQTTSCVDTSRLSSVAKRVTGGGLVSDSPSGLRRILTLTKESPRPDGVMSQQQLESVREKEREFYRFMDAELEKVETFYKLKEEQAGKRLAILREQLHEMRNRRLQEMSDPSEHDDHYTLSNGSSENGHSRSNGWVQPIKAKIFPPGPNSKALRTMSGTPHIPPSSSGETRRDYTRRRPSHDVSYRTAKRKLKLALQEFYRGLELLKSYALLNRTAFRKLNKKFDKAANARPPLRYVHEKVNRAWFVNSDILEGHIKAVEDLYSRYFERGNYKLAAGKLRSHFKKTTDESGSSFLSGFLIGTGIVFAVQGLAYGTQLLYDEDADVREHTRYLLQLYAGYFLMLLLFALFCIDCFIWTKNKVNYPFIFEFDQRSHIDWRRLSEFPSFFLLLMGLFMWMNFSRYGAEWLFLYYPVILICITACILLLPAPVLAYKTRKWFVYAHWRLLLAGIYPVEFRDFFLGDMYCSLTYCMANIELFFCLYANHWTNEAQCNSSNSRLLGFFLTLPPIWRFLQCLRRYWDTRNVFPHLVNGGKYAMTIVSYVLLSLYRIDGTHTKLALYITFALFNSIYVSIWDLFMDFSILQPHSRHFLLRDILALKRRWPYYLALAADPMLRFVWIFYAIFTHDTQHSTIVSFLVSLMEVFRRGLWALFRVENEHCANVAQYKASRDVPLPYRIEPLMAHVSETTSPVLQTEEELQKQRQRQQQAQQRLQQKRHEATQSGASSTAVASTLGSLRRRADTTSAYTFSKLLAEAHTQDFEKRRKPAAAGAGGAAGNDTPSDDEDDEDEDDDEGSLGLDRQRGMRRPSDEGQV
ncbi:hypothetical protein HIM_06070 [Hirsutella minnesotensis 3608]|uniref:EXS domain-containing protein n=1 Tax=Hirsutella minnesotensis 3608 TaxID=1043627 RepID=A0A0F8A502_9HYPO|nr:hypothetical protein HIM_06070 [Hirsutella minnesotensis 3608]